LQYDNESEVEDLMNPTDELKKKIVTLADTMRKWNDDNIKARKTVKKQLEEIVNLGLNRYHMERIDLRRLVEKIF
jgi:predicted  nucleic acid-binding Zn-ribbon protein